MPLKHLLIFYLIFVYQGCNSSIPKPLRLKSDSLSKGEVSFSKRINMDERMNFYNVKGVSIAVINNFQLEWAKGYGVKEAGFSSPITPNTLFQSGSIGKSVVAAATLHFVELGELNLDENVNVKLKSWQVSSNSFTQRKDVTIRELLSHSAGATLPGVIGYAQGEPIPNLIQILNGEPPANTPPIHIDRVPGTAFQYSGGGFLIVQQLLIDLFDSQKSFPSIITEVVFNPVDMKNSTFDYWPNKSKYEVATGHRSEGSPVDGKWFNYPEMGMGVFWTTPSDMAQFVSEIMLAYNGNSEKILSKETVQLMLSPQIENQGLGVNLADDGKDRFYFYHRGAIEGYQTFMVGYPKRGQGAIIMTNSDNGYFLIEEILKNLSLTYRWVGGIYF
jgi:CubicO group peptidase (beta-lactamase class C family)